MQVPNQITLSADRYATYLHMAVVVPELVFALAELLDAIDRHEFDGEALVMAEAALELGDATVNQLFGE